MDPLVRRYLKTAIGFLGVGLILGLVMIARRELLGAGPSPLWVGAHTHALLVGFVMMMIQGVALWMFPRPDRADVRYRPKLAELAYWLVAVSTAARVVAELVRPSTGGMALRWMIVVAGFGQVAGLLVFFVNMWPRIRSAGARSRAP
jgi:heme/copper-type cytochrome/quinol oxidase subunit 1